MRVIENGKSDDEAVHLSFDAAQAALASGAYEHAPLDGERGPDQPAAQTPKPGTDPVNGKEQAAPDSPLTNLMGVGAVSEGLPPAPDPVVVKAEPAKAEPAAKPIAAK